MISERVLLTGASGYVGGRLLRVLEPRGGSIRCLARRPETLLARVGAATEVVGGDVLDRESLEAAMRDVHTAYYLVHSMGAGSDFAERDRLGAGNFGSAAGRADVRRIIYLGGLGRSGGPLSKHLRSRQETGDALRESGVPVVEFRASIIIGSGSLSFEMIRALVDRLPVMICPRWVSARTQPIAIDDVLSYLVAGLDLAEESRICEIGGPDVVSYADLMREYARQRGLRRVMLPVPLLTPRLSSLWLGLVTPLYARVGRKLIEGVRNATVVRDPSGMREFAIRPLGIGQAIARAIAEGGERSSGSHWSESVSSAALPLRPSPAAGPVFRDERHAEIAATPDEVFAALGRVGGASGWYSHGLLWKMRGLLDLLVGGVGLRRGRRHPRELIPGDHVDFWRVERSEPPRLLRLEAEMRLPGRAWLEFRVEPVGQGRSDLFQTAIFNARGMAGRLYWHAVSPLHRLVFGGLLRGIAARAVAGVEGRSRTTS